MSDSRRIVILGKTGVGKSSLANTIFGERWFTIGDTINSETSRCQAETKTVGGRSLTLIDSPGFFDTDRSEKVLKAEVLRCVTEYAPGPHAFLIVLKVERFTEQEQAVIAKMDSYFSKEFFKFATVLFTHGDQLPPGKNIQQFIANNQLVNSLVAKCGGRCHVIDNRYWNQPRPEDPYRSNALQVSGLLLTIERMIQANGRRCYTNEILQAVEKKIQEEAEALKRKQQNLSDAEARRQSKDRVFAGLCVGLAAVATGVLLVALFSVTGPSGAVVAAAVLA